MSGPIRTALSSLPLLALLACDLPQDGKDGTGDTASDTGAAGTDTTDTTGGGGGGGEAGWTLIPLLDDGDIFHSNNDLVTGIHYTDVDHGVVVTTGDNGTFAEGGAIYSAKHRELSSVLLGGYDAAQCLLGTTDFIGLTATADGYVAQAQVCDLIASHDGGKTFEVGPVAVGDPFGIEEVLAWSSVGGHTIVIRDTGVVSVTDDAPGPNAIWDDIWAPGGLPPTPDPVPADQCQLFEGSTNVPTVAQDAFISEDQGLIAYGSAGYYEPQVCISTDGGHSFFPHVLEGVDPDVNWAGPTGVLFSTATNGVTWYANNIYPDATYIQHTSDGGETWKKAELPSRVVGTEIELREAFFAPGTDGQVGWLVGYDYEHDIALLLKTVDGGATWDTSGGDLAQVISDGSYGYGKLWTGFALDANHIWVGGKYGIFASNDAGGE